MKLRDLKQRRVSTDQLDRIKRWQSEDAGDERSKVFFVDGLRTMASESVLLNNLHVQLHTFACQETSSSDTGGRGLLHTNTGSCKSIRRTGVCVCVELKMWMQKVLRSKAILYASVMLVEDEPVMSTCWEKMNPGLQKSQQWCLNALYISSSIWIHEDSFTLHCFAIQSLWSPPIAFYNVLLQWTAVFMSCGIEINFPLRWPVTFRSHWKRIILNEFLTMGQLLGKWEWNPTFTIITSTGWVSITLNLSAPTWYQRGD